MLFLIVTEPKLKYRQAYHTIIEVHSAVSKKEAISKAEKLGRDWKAPVAHEIKDGMKVNG